VRNAHRKRFNTREIHILDYLNNSQFIILQTAILSTSGTQYMIGWSIRGLFRTTYYF